MTRSPWQITREMFLSVEETAQLLRYVRDAVDSATGAARQTFQTDCLIIELLLFSGVRNSEFCRLQIADVIDSPEESALKVHETATRTRMVYLPRWLVKEIGRYVREVRPALVTSDDDSSNAADGALILNERGRAYERTALYRRVQRILTPAGLKDRASVQLLRHTYGYLAYRQSGGNLLFVQRQLGHAHPMVTAIYAQFVDEQPAEVADLIGRNFRPAAES